MDGFRAVLVGCERSGTTLLRAMLDRHPALAVPPESYFLVTLGRRSTRYARGDGGFDAPAFVDDLLAEPDFRRWALPPDEVRAAVLAARPRDVAAAARAVFALHATREGKPGYADKTPAYVLALPRLAAMLPEARFVHLVRDGRDVALSLVDRSHKPPDTVAEAALWWRRRVLAGLDAGAALGPDRYREVRYEALVADPEPVLRELLAWLGLPWDAAVLDPGRRAGEIAAAFDHPDQHTSLRRPVTVGLRDWRSAMSSSDARVFGALAGEALARTGYDPGPAPDLRARLTGVRALALATGRRRAGSARRLGRAAADRGGRFRRSAGGSSERDATVTVRD